jgi:hypothetical protein
MGFRKGYKRDVNSSAVQISVKLLCQVLVVE